MATKFAVGDRVAWTHGLGVVYGQNSTLRADFVKSMDKEANLGTVTKTDVDGLATWFEVEMDETHEKKVLTAEELVKIEEVPVVP